MHRLRCRSFSYRVVLRALKGASKLRGLLPVLMGILTFSLTMSGVLRCQVPSRVTEEIDVSQMQVLPNHHPQWANPANEAGAVPADLKLGPLTMVLARSAEQEQAFIQLLADQQNPASPEYHRWLTPEQVGARFGLSQADIDAVSGWLTSQGLQVNWVSSSRMLINFSGTAADMNRAFQTEFRNYKVNGEERISVSSDPMIPQALAPVVTAVRGLYTVDERPQHQVRTVQLDAPENTSLSGNHYIAPADFTTIYDLPSGLTGAGFTIGIVGESRTNFGDFDTFRQRTLSTFPNPTEIVPTAYGGVDPGPALTSGTAGGAQMEATLDVTRAGSVAPGAKLLLVTASAASGGIFVDAEYLVDTSPAPAQVMSISFGACELLAGSGATASWEVLFQHAAAEGISTFVSSGDSGASGCDADGGPPPANPQAISINYLCASGYVTCVGGSEFNDLANPSQYWSSSNGAGLLSALSYIPEGGWNDPLSSSSTTEVLSSGGGVSIYAATPAWQAGVGVPADRTGRYTPDISFSGSCHDGYFMCVAASGGTCITGTNGTFSFLAVCGTSASAPSMAGVAALLNQKLGTAQGSVNQSLYAMAASTPAAFHDITVATSGVTNCSLNTASMCNNSIPSQTSITGGEAGYLVGTGYDEVTGLGSLDVSSFINNYVTRFVPPLALTPSASSITVAQPLTVSVLVGAVSGLATPTGSVALTSGSYSSGATALNSSGSANINISAGVLAPGIDTLTATYTPDSSSSTLYASAVNTTSVTVVAPGFQISGSSVTVSKGSAGTSTVTVTPSGGFTGNVALTAAITSSPSGAQYLPTLSFGTTSPVSITGSTAQTATLTISTTAATSGALVYPVRPGSRWYASGGTALACILPFCVPMRRRGWRAVFGVLALLFALAGGMLACGGGGGSGGGGGGGGGGGISGTTSGAYTITVTATSGSTSATSTVALTVQ